MENHAWCHCSIYVFLLLFVCCCYFCFVLFFVDGVGVVGGFWFVGGRAHGEACVILPVLSTGFVLRNSMSSTADGFSAPASSGLSTYDCRRRAPWAFLFLFLLRDPGTFGRPTDTKGIVGMCVCVCVVCCVCVLGGRAGGGHRHHRRRGEGVAEVLRTACRQRRVDPGSHPDRHACCACCNLSSSRRVNSALRKLQPEWLSVLVPKELCYTRTARCASRQRDTPWPGSR